MKVGLNTVSFKANTLPYYYAPVPVQQPQQIMPLTPIPKAKDDPKVEGFKRVLQDGYWHKSYNFNTGNVNIAHTAATDMGGFTITPDGTVYSGATLGGPGGMIIKNNKLLQEYVQAIKQENLIVNTFVNEPVYNLDNLA